MKMYVVAFFALSALALAQEINPRHIVVPSYPLIARNSRVQGSVVLHVEVGGDGKVKSVGATGNRMLSEAAEDNIRQWVFTAGAPGKVTVTYIYMLAGNETYDIAPSQVILDLPERVQITTQPRQTMQ
jgi:TonB family protein